MTTDLPPGWVSTTLENVVDILDSKRVPVKKSERDKRPGNVPYFGATGQAGWIDKPIFNEELLLLGEDGAPFLDPAKRKAYIIDGPAWVNNHAHVLRAITDLATNKFLKYQLDWMPYEGRVTGTTRLKLTQRVMRQLPVVLPAVAKQKRIVAAIEEHFSRLDAIEASIEDADGRLYALYRSVAVDAFDRPDWEWTTLGEIAEVKGGITKDSKREAPPEFDEFPYLRVANVQRGHLDLSHIATIRADRRKAQRLVLRPGDILFNEGGDRDKLGRGWVWEGQIEECIHQNHVFRARLVDDRFDPYFVSLHANSWGQKWFESHGKQTTNLASLNLTTLKSFPVPAPSAQVQRTVASHMRSALDSVQHQRLELGRVAARTSSLRRSILAEAFAGRLDYQDSRR